MILAFLCAAVFFTSVGLPLARRVAPVGVPPLAMAPALGWAVFVTLALPALGVVGFGGGLVLSLALVSVGAAVLLLVPRGQAAMPRWGIVLAAAVGVLPAVAVLPKHVSGGVLLAPPMFDHVKIALVDAILRDGLPVPNPFVGPDSPGRLAYYYLWHFGTAMLAAGLHVSGWTAEAGATWFTAFASLMLMMGVAVALGGRGVAVAATALLALPGSARPVVDWVVGENVVGRVVPRGADFGGWLNQAAWVPQHLASACCVVLAGLLMLRLAEAAGLVVAAVLGVVVAAGFESSVWVGGIAFAVAGGVLGGVLLWRMPLAARRGFLVWGVGAAVVAGVLIAPMVAAELGAARLRGGGGVAVMPYAVVGAGIPAVWRPVVDAVAFWLLVGFELPAILPLGVAFLVLRRVGRVRLAVGVLAAGCLGVAWLFRSTIDNNDLGWRAVLPAVMVLGAGAGCGVEWLVAGRRWGVLAAAVCVAALGVPDAGRMVAEYVGGQRPGDAAGLAAAGPVWAAVRRHAGPDERVANNPDDLGAVTPWPVNIGWAVRGDRPSCYAGWETVLAYGVLPKPVLLETARRFARVFGGGAAPGDLERMAGCNVAVVVPTDGAWSRDPFAASKLFVLAEGAPGWRIYRRADSAVRPH